MQLLFLKDISDNNPAHPKEDDKYKQKQPHLKKGGAVLFLEVIGWTKYKGAHVLIRSNGQAIPIYQSGQVPSKRRCAMKRLNSPVGEGFRVLI